MLGIRVNNGKRSKEGSRQNRNILDGKTAIPLILLMSKYLSLYNLTSLQSIPSPTHAKRAWLYVNNPKKSEFISPCNTIQKDSLTQVSNVATKRRIFLFKTRVEITYQGTNRGASMSPSHDTVQ